MPVNAPQPPERSDSLSFERRPQIPPRPLQDSQNSTLLQYNTNNTAGRNMSNTQESQAEMPFPQEFDQKSHFKHAFKNFHEFYELGYLCDISICVGKKTFNCHRMILASVSSYFRAMFQSEMAESHSSSVTIHDIDETAMEKLILFAYTSKFQISVENVQPLLYASSILQIESVAKACCDFMKKHLHPTNCVAVYNFAELHNRTELMKMTFDYMLERFVEVFSLDDLKNVSFKLMLSCLSSLDLNVDDEVEAYEALMKWVKTDTKERKRHLSALLSQVKLPLMSASYLQKNVACNDLIKKDLECRDLLDDARHHKMAASDIELDVNISERTRPRKSCAGMLFCVGGRGAAGDPFKSIECYDYRKNKWFKVTEMNTRRRHVGVCCSENLLYAVGGHDGTQHLNSGEVFDSATNTWKTITPMSTSRRGIAVASLGGPVYVVGGLDDATCYRTVERYDPRTDTWEMVADMSSPRGGVGVASLKGYLYAIGGNNGISSLNECERYDPLCNKWTKVTSMSRARAGAGVAVLDGCIYVVGGFDDNSPLDSCEKYDPQSDKWTFVANMSCSRGGVGVGSLGGKLFAVGGHDGTNYLSSVEAFDPLTNSWSPVTDLIQCRAGAVLAFCHLSPKIFTVNLDGPQRHLPCM